MKINSNTTYSLIGAIGIFAVIALVFTISAPVANGQVFYYQPNQFYTSPLTVSCYANQTSVYAGNSTNWYATASGGNGTYNYYWSGDEGLSGYGSNLLKTYYNVGTKYASVTVTSGNQTITRSCNNSVYVSASPYGYYPYNYYAPLQVSCNTNSPYNIPAGTAVSWYATVTGGYGSYSYNWSGTDGLYGYNQAISYVYNNPGSKYAYVTVTSNNQSVTAACTNTVAVSYPSSYIYNQYGYVGSNNSSGLDVTCYPDPASISINQPATWNSTVTGGIAPYRYSWTGSDGLSSTGNSAIKYYSTSGEKNAILTVTSADNRTTTRACSDTLTVRSPASATRPANTDTNTQAPAQRTTPTQPTQDNSQLSAASVGVFSNIPWGWISVLIILVLFFTVLYLLFNRQKI